MMPYKNGEASNITNDWMGVPNLSRKDHSDTNIECETTMEHYIQGDIDLLMNEASSLLLNGSIDSIAMFLSDDDDDDVEQEEPEEERIKHAQEKLHITHSPNGSIQDKHFNVEGPEEFQGVYKSLRSRPVFYRELCGSSEACGSMEHARASTGEAVMYAYSCGHCHLVFQFMSMLDEHMKTHWTARDANQPTSCIYACNVCHYSTNEKGAIKKHVTRKHYNFQSKTVCC